MNSYTFKNSSGQSHTILADSLDAAWRKFGQSGIGSINEYCLVVPKMTLAKMDEVTTFDQLKPFIEYLCDGLLDIEYREFLEYRRELELAALRIGSSVALVNSYAETYQIYGRDCDQSGR